MRLGIITYDCNHLKTEQVLIGLHNTEYSEVCVFALPFSPRPARLVLFPHRPDMNAGAHPRDVSRALGFDYELVEGPEKIPTNNIDHFLITGAGILPESFVSATRGKVLNCHPGIIPLVRGLDSFKWAIVDDQPVGCTLHFISEEADAGEVLKVSPTPMFATDSLETFAKRHYESEIQLLVNFERYLQKPAKPVSGNDARPARLRMPRDIEKKLRDAFEIYKASHLARQPEDADK